MGRAAMLGVFAVFVAGCGGSSITTSSVEARDASAGSETARIVLIDYFVGLGAADAEAVERVVCRPLTDASELFGAYQEAVASNGLIRLKVGSVDPAAAAGNVAFSVTTSADEFSFVAVMTEDSDGGICMSEILGGEGSSSLPLPVWISLTEGA